jgi:hypothetical protein
MKFYLLGMLLIFSASITHAQLKGIVFRQDSTKNFPLENAKIRLIRANLLCDVLRTTRFAVDFLGAAFFTPTFGNLIAEAVDFFPPPKMVPPILFVNWKRGSSSLVLHDSSKSVNG